MVARNLIVSCLCLALLVGFSDRSFAAEGDVYVSIPKISLSSDQSIVSFEIDISAGGVTSVSNLPIGWVVTIDNDASWQTKIKGSATIGAASLSSDEFGTILISIKKNEFGDLRFDLSGTASVTKDFSSEINIPIKMSNFKIYSVRP